MRMRRPCSDAAAERAFTLLGQHVLPRREQHLAGDAERVALGGRHQFDAADGRRRTGAVLGEQVAELLLLLLDPRRVDGALAEIGVLAGQPFVRGSQRAHLIGHAGDLRLHRFVGADHLTVGLRTDASGGAAERRNHPGVFHRVPPRVFAIMGSPTDQTIGGHGEGSSGARQKPRCAPAGGPGPGPWGCAAGATAPSSRRRPT
jgi:hypothetical protein